MKVMGRSSIQKVEVRADGTALSSRAGTALLPLAAERLGLTDALGWALGETRERRSAHDPGRVFCDLAVMLADGGRCVSDLVALGSQPALFGDVASVSTARRVLLSIGQAELDRLRRARAQARERAWAAGAAPAEVILDFDATPITAHSDKELAAGHYKGGFGFNPLLVTCGREGPGSDPAPRQRRRQQRRRSRRTVRAGARAAPAAGAGRPDSRALGLGRRQPRAGRRLPRDRRALLVRLRDGRAGARGDTGAARAVVAAGDQRRRAAARGRLGGRTHRSARARLLAAGLPPDRPPRAPASRRPALVHRRRRAPLFSASSPISPTRIWRPWRPATAPTRSSKTASANSRAPACPTCRSRHSHPTRRGWKRRWSPTISPSGPSCCSSTANMPSASPSDCATGCCTSPASSPATPAS